ncbi:protein serine/threonine phosphatase 2C [Coniochaeta ligniaria NRRL 30616]|uniref:Protein serine/threonine phosphatase 2C n=1 Tax=Coniochaeta ligniaria NRRL 30616 TaxID=1408157 RepID=A0A1J7JXV9_9PEZI|nr:protein serine/threonine phosphatase 2C [Coniochaeta ligniaria NRRL 30616]
MSLRLAPTRVGRGLASSRLQTRARKSYSTANSSSASTTSKTFTYIAIATVVSAPGIWWLGTNRDEVPCLESLPATHLAAEPGPSKDEVTRIISRGAYSLPVRSVGGVERYDGAQLASNSPCEDRATHGKFPSPFNDGSQWIAWAVLDGHAGWQTAHLLEKQLLPSVRQSLSQVKSDSNGQYPGEDVIQRAIGRAFVDLDDSIIKTAWDTAQSKEPLQDKVKKLIPAYAGSCALLSVYDPVTSTLHVACTGDSRAVLGQKRPDGTWEAIPLSVDQNGSNKEEVARINREHPGEEGIAQGGRILGITVSRAFGDGRWKWPLELQQDLKRRFHGPSPLNPKYDVRTPPYLTAEPVVTATKIDPSKPSFLIMATVGMWDMLSNQQAVDLVGKWLGSGGTGKSNDEPQPTYGAFDFGQFRKGERRTTIQDNNAAVHLVRNALGGNHHELIAGRLAFDSPFSRNFRNDVTVQVVFFASKGTV